MNPTLSKNKSYTKQIVIAAMLTAFSIIIPMLPFKLPLPQPFSVTLASHVPTIVAMFISPWVAVCTVIGSTIGFLISVSPIVAIRAASHIVFAVTGALLLKKRCNPYVVLLVCAILHGLFEALMVIWFGPLFGFTQDMLTAQYIWGTVFGITIFHHCIDCLLSVILLVALEKAKFIKDTRLLPAKVKQ